MRRIDELHLNYPFAGSRMLRDLLGQQGLEVGRRHIRTLMKRMCIEAIYRRPNTSKPAPGQRSYPYLLRGLAFPRPTQARPIYLTYIPMPPGFFYSRATPLQPEGNTARTGLLQPPARIYGSLNQRTELPLRNQEKLPE